MDKTPQAILQIVTDSKEFCRLLIKLIHKIKLKKMIQITKEELWIRKMLKPQKEEPMDKTDFRAIAQTSIFKTTELQWMLVQIAHLPQEIKTTFNSTVITKEDIQV